MEVLKIDELGGDYVAREIIERSKNKDIIYLTEDIILNTKCVQQLSEYIENLIARNKELEEYKKIAELTKVSCCTAQNCEALNNAIREGLENTKLKEKIEKLESALNNSVSKNEIKEKIEQLKMNADYDWIYKYDYQDVIKVLQELLNKGE